MQESSSRRVTFNWFTRYTVTNGSSSGTSGHYSLYQTLNRSRTGTSLPGWKQKIALIQDATTTFSGSNASILYADPIDVFVGYKSPPGQLNSEALWGVMPIEGTLPDPSTINDTEASNIARRKVLSQVQNARSSFQGGPFVAEIRDTIRGILHPLRGIREGLTSFHSKAKKLKRKERGAHLLNALSDTWLEFQFGWLPLSSDINGALNQLRRISQPRPIRFEARGVTTTQSNLSAGSLLDNLTLSIERRKELQSTALVVYRGAYKAMPPYGWDWTSWGLGTQDFLPSVWEAIPYSFAVDYFTNIGQIISAYSYIPSNIAWVSKTSRKRMVYTYRGTKLNPGAAYPVTQVTIGGLGVTSIALTKVSRGSVSLNELIPQFMIHVPGAGSLQWLNITALAHLRLL